MISSVSSVLLFLAVLFLGFKCFNKKRLSAALRVGKRSNYCMYACMCAFMWACLINWHASIFTSFSRWWSCVLGWLRLPAGRMVSVLTTVTESLTTLASLNVELLNKWNEKINATLFIQMLDLVWNSSVAYSYFQRKPLQHIFSVWRSDFFIYICFLIYNMWTVDVTNQRCWSLSS